ncbi:hypothetical protein C0991_000442 [Blastosporella zonata]|nr:hypothetical protein C0991_000442 [Blastosporella zonata]
MSDIRRASSEQRADCLTYCVMDYASLESTSKWRNLPPPPGFSKSSASSSKAPTKSSGSTQRYDQLKANRAWEAAIAPAKALPMQAFMLYMSGGGVQIFSMGIVFMLLLTPFKNVAGINEAFAQFAPTNSQPKAFTTLALQKLVFIVCNLLTLGVGLWKCRSMGLLPMGSGDWLAFETRGVVRFQFCVMPIRE